MSSIQIQAVRHSIVCCRMSWCSSSRGDSVQSHVSSKLMIFALRIPRFDVVSMVVVYVILWLRFDVTLAASIDSMSSSNCSTRSFVPFGQSVVTDVQFLQFVQWFYILLNILYARGELMILCLWFAEYMNQACVSVRFLFSWLQSHCGVLNETTNIWMCCIS